MLGNSESAKSQFNEQKHLLHFPMRVAVWTLDYLRSSLIVNLTSGLTGFQLRGAQLVKKQHSNHQKAKQKVIHVYYSRFRCHLAVHIWEFSEDENVCTE